ncbi:MAG: hypothetical protein ABIA56_01030 [Actinomycetota bacterium]
MSNNPRRKWSEFPTRQQLEKCIIRTLNYEAYNDMGTIAKADQLISNQVRLARHIGGLVKVKPLAEFKLMMDDEAEMQLQQRQMKQM